MGGEGNSEVLGQTVVDWTVVGLNVGRWVSQSSVARRLLSSQTASKLSLAGWRSAFQIRYNCGTRQCWKLH